MTVCRVQLWAIRLVGVVPWGDDRCASTMYVLVYLQVGGLGGPEMVFGLHPLHSQVVVTCEECVDGASRWQLSF